AKKELIEQYLPDGHPDKIKKFEIGRWYKSNKGNRNKVYYYIKVTMIEKDVIYGEKINTDRSYHSSDESSSCWDALDSLKQALEIGPMKDLSEIQDYLPDRHVDKSYIPKKGEYYYQSSSTWGYGYISICGSKEAIETNGTYLRDFAYQNCDKNRPATKEEKQWLDACIKAGKFISKEEALETEEERLLKEAKRRYPVGTKFSCLVAGGTYEVDVDVTFKYESGMIYSYRNGGVYHKHFDGSKWAKIVPEVKKWDVGTYVVFIKNYGRSKIGYIDKIVESNIGTNGCLCEKELTTTKGEEYVKWFATKEEAEEFAKTLIPQLSVGDYFVSESYSKHIGRITEIYNDGTRYRYWGFSVLRPFRENDWYNFSDTKPRKATDK
ncbi:MAG TPA: hypothetical protein PLR64_04150, partial [Candidatus Dojkabacteria bacterium]|nr:hypothetical protein [Candidatus Dojkabacteria bacterium]